MAAADRPGAAVPPGPDTTGVVSSLRPRLAEFFDADPPLPVGYLLVIGGAARGLGAVLEQLPLVVGRAPGVGVEIPDETVSRRHAELIGDHYGVCVRDLGSANGTRVNGNPFAGELHVRDGDVLELGSAVVLVKLFT